MNNLANFAHTQGPLFILAVIASSLIAEDFTGVAIGVLVAQGSVGFSTAVLSFFAGIYLGDMGLYFIGRGLGFSAIERVPLRWIISSQDIERCRQWFDHRGPIIIFISRFIPGMRLPVFASAGISKFSLPQFSGWLLLAVAVWSPLIVGGSMLFGAKMLACFASFKKYALASFIVLIFAILTIVKIFIPLMSFRGRRYLASRIKRFWYWEFWPLGIFYFPVIGYIIFLALRYRSLTLFTAGNPGIEAGGFVGESKYEILNNLNDFGGFVARSQLIKASHDLNEKKLIINKFLTDNHLNFPVVLKPDVGQRGDDVKVVNDWEDIDHYLKKIYVDIVIQEHVPGEEFGVFYYRFPNEKKGRIFTITEKKFPYVTGDGKSTLEHLILRDSRAICMTQAYFEKQLKNLWNVPMLGQEVQLTHIGSHCKGAIFYDGTYLKTPALEAAIDELSQKFAGFYFGRYDIRARSVEDFQKGQNFKVLELNGVTAEATNIYDPKYNVLDAYKILFKQWSILFAIAYQNKLLGAQVTPFKELTQMVFNYYRR